MSKSGDASGDDFSEWIRDINLSDEQVSTSSSDEAVQEAENEVFHPILFKFFQAYLTRNQKNFWIVKLTKSRNGESYYKFESFRSDASTHAAVSFVKRWPSYVKEQKDGNYKIDSVKVYTIYTPCQKCLTELLRWLKTEDSSKLSIHYAVLSTPLNQDKRWSISNEMTKYLNTTIDMGANTSGNMSGLVELHKIDTVSFTDLVKYLGQPLNNKPRNIKIREELITRIPKVRLKTETGFSHLVSSFFNACQYASWPVTYWIIELSTSSSSNDKSIVNTFAAVKNLRNERHAEMIFINWWASYGKKLKREGSTCDSLKVYTNYTPCTECVPRLKGWLNNEKNPKLSMHYQFAFTFFNTHTAPEDQIKTVKKLFETKNLLEMNKIEPLSLSRLAARVNFQGGVDWDYDTVQGQYDNEGFEEDLSYTKPA